MPRIERRAGGFSSNANLVQILLGMAYRSALYSLGSGRQELLFALQNLGLKGRKIIGREIWGQESWRVEKFQHVFLKPVDRPHEVSLGWWHRWHGKNEKLGAEVLCHQG